MSGAANAQQIAAELLEVWKEPNSNGHRLTFGIQFGPDVTLLDRDIIRITYETIPIDHGGVVAGIPSDVWLPQNGPTQVYSSDYSPTTMIATLGIASGIYDNRLTPAGAVVPTQVSFKGTSITGGNSAPYTTPSASTYGFVINDVNINNAVINPLKVSLERPIRPSGPYDGQTSVLLEGEVTFRGRTLEKGSGPFAGAGSYVCCGATDDVPPAKFVPGKEYSDRADTNQKGETTPEQTLLWDGLGNVKDGFRYGTSGEVDGMSYGNDSLFEDLLDNEATLLFSTTGDGRAPILYTTPDGSNGAWATVPEINKNGVTDLDGLEVWGEEGTPNANRYSLVGDPDGIAVFRHTASSPLADWTVEELARAIGLPQNLYDEFDLDGLMTLDDKIIFSIAPVGDFDGGEIWWYQRNGVAAHFLMVGPHLFDTALDVQGTFGTRSENIDALEAVKCPDTSGGLTTMLAVTGILCFMRLRRHESPSPSNELGSPRFQVRVQ